MNLITVRDLSWKPLFLSATLALAAGGLAGCSDDASTSGGSGGEGGAAADDTVETSEITPFSIAATVPGAEVVDVAAALSSYIHDRDDTEDGMPADWILAGGDQLHEGAEPIEAVLSLPGGGKIVEVCNHHYATQAMSFGSHHGVALPCEISVNQNGDDVDVVLLNPEAIFQVFFGDVPAEAQVGMADLAATVRGELESLVASSLLELDSEPVGRDVGPSWNADDIMAYQSLDYSIVRSVELPDDAKGDADAAAAFKAELVEQILTLATHEEMDSVGSTVEGLSTGDWRSARPYALGLPGQVSVVEMCSPTYATAALSTGDYHAPALPCEMAVWVEGDSVEVHMLDPGFIFPVFFSDAPDEMMEDMGQMVEAVQSDLQLIVDEAIEQVLAAP